VISHTVLKLLRTTTVVLKRSLASCQTSALWVNSVTQQAAATAVVAAATAVAAVVSVIEQPQQHHIAGN
jgi:hypothetical protein